MMVLSTRNFTIWIVLAVLSMLVTDVKADWVLDERSSGISFSTIKKTNIGEAHSFLDFSGGIQSDVARIVIRSDSVDTQVPIRDERMRQFLFRSEIFPEIIIDSDVADVLSRLKKNAIINVDLPAKLTLNGVSKVVNLRVNVVSHDNKNLMVVSAKPVIIKAVDYQMASGVAKLSELVGGIPIPSAVPVSFVLFFKKK